METVKAAPHRQSRSPARKSRPATHLPAGSAASLEAVAVQVAVFPSSLGWIAILGRGGRLAGLTFGQPTAKDALARFRGDVCLEPARDWNTPLVERLQRYADGHADAFLDVELDIGRLTPFQAAVIEACRRIPLGQTRTYGELAIEAGRPGAARAVGNVMARNCIPLVIPCHRVVGSSGGLGGYSGVEGLVTKRRLLALEAAALER